MLDHVEILVADFDRAKAFYDAAMAPLGASMLHQAKSAKQGMRYGAYGRETTVFWVVESDLESGRGRHYAFAANSRAEVDAFHAAALAAGGRDNGAPGLRPVYHAHYYGAFVIDPDGNNVEAVCHHPE